MEDSRHKSSVGDNFIGVAVGNYVIILSDAREVQGHDDTIPYDAEWEVLFEEKSVCEGRVWNDGWGGTSVLEYDRKNHSMQLAIDDIDRVCKENFADNCKGRLRVEYDFVDILDTLAYIYIYCGKENHGNVFSIEAVNDFINE